MERREGCGCRGQQDGPADQEGVRDDRQRHVRHQGKTPAPDEVETRPAAHDGRECGAHQEEEEIQTQNIHHLKTTRHAL